MRRVRSIRIENKVWEEAKEAAEKVRRSRPKYIENVVDEKNKEILKEKE